MIQTNYLNVKKPWITEIKGGRKTIEGRKGNVEKYQHWIGKEAIFRDEDTTILVNVKGVRHYKDIHEYLENEDLTQVAPHIENDKEKVLEAYRELGITDDIIKAAGGFNGIIVEFKRTL
jgi:ASC-1-like (ASCH) protein